MKNILEVHNLHKQYPGIQAVDGINFTVSEGICFGLLGPNGAGKTTTIEMMEGLIKPNKGKIFYKGNQLGKQFHHEAGVQFQATALQDFLSVRENIRLFQSFYKINMPFEELVAMCALEPFLDQDASKLSGGQRQRLLLAIALVNDPNIVFLDEPTTGLDPQARLNFWDLVNTIKARNKTVLLTTHYMEEAYHLCDQIIIMDHGKIIAQGSPDALLEQQFTDTMIELPRQALENVLADFPYKLFAKDNGNVEIPTQDVNGVLAYLLEKKVDLVKLRVRPRTLEDLFLELTGKELRS